MPATHVPATTEPPRLPPLLVVPWPDPVADDLGLDPRGTYVERFWLPLLGPPIRQLRPIEPVRPGARIP